MLDRRIDEVHLDARQRLLINIHLSRSFQAVARGRGAHPRMCGCVCGCIYAVLLSVLDYGDMTYRHAASSTLNTWTLPSGVLLVMLTVPIIAPCMRRLAGLLYEMIEMREMIEMISTSPYALLFE